jgi:voltage-gated potassium channel
MEEEVTKRKLTERLIMLIGLVGIVLIIGTIAYHALEKWTYVDALYFSTVTLTTIGYGDIVPKTVGGKLFTVFFALTGIAIMFYLLTVMGTSYIHYLEQQRPVIRSHVQKAFGFKPKKDKWVMLKIKDPKNP